VLSSPAATSTAKTMRKFWLAEPDEGAMMEATDNLTPMAHSAQNRCFGCGEANPVGLHLEFFLTGDNSVVCLPTVGDAYEGPHGYLHGGIIATLLDEAMSKAVRAQGFTAMTRHIEVDYLRPVPSASAIRVEGRVVRDEGRKHWVEAKILDEKGTTLAHAKGVFIDVRPR
jgi:uncharacterized protein (TIGR00369 family)